MDRYSFGFTPFIMKYHSKYLKVFLYYIQSEYRICNIYSISVFNGIPVVNNFALDVN